MRKTMNLVLLSDPNRQPCTADVQVLAGGRLNAGHFEKHESGRKPCKLNSRMYVGCHIIMYAQ